MTYLVLLSAMALGLIGSAGLLKPAWVVGKIGEIEPQRRFELAFGIRLLLGLILLMAAPDSRFPTVFLVLGGVTIAAAFALRFAGLERFNRLVDWGSGLPAAALRLSFLLAAGFGAFLVYSVA